MFGPSHFSPQVTRRAAMQIGVGMFGLSLPKILQAAKHAGAQNAGREMSCIFIFLAGGPSQFETFDPKPDAPAEVRGLWKPTSTNVPGTFICEKLPLMAKRMDKVAIVRSWQGRSGSHATGSQHVASGFFPTSVASCRLFTAPRRRESRPISAFLSPPAIRRLPDTWVKRMARSTSRAILEARNSRSGS